MTALTRRTFLFTTALPLFGQFSRHDLLTPWLRGDPAGTERLLTIMIGFSHSQDFTLRCAADFETDRGNYPQARQFLTRAIYFNDHKELNNRREARLRSAVGDFSGAEKAALNGHHWNGDIKKLRGINPLALNVLGEVYAARGMHQSALAILQRSLRLASGETQAEWAEAKVLMAFSRLALNDTKAALADAEEALSVARKKWGEYGPRTLDALEALGAALTGLGRFDEAKTWFAFALTSRKPLYNRPHYKMAGNILHAAWTLSVQGHHPEAIELAEHGLRAMQEALPPANARTALALAKVAEVYQAAGSLAEARTRFENAARLGALFLGDDAPFVQGLSRKLMASPA